jgi:hypothetical protein
MKHAPRLIELYSEPHAFLFSSWQNVRIAVWARQATGPALERLDKITHEMVRVWPNGISSIHVARGDLRMSSAPPPPMAERLPTSEARVGFKSLMERYAQLACVAVLIEGSGFGASALRSVITGMRIESLRTLPMRLCATIDEVVEWLPAEHHKLTGVRLEPEKLRETLLEVSKFLP